MSSGSDLAREELLGQRRPVVRKGGLGADQDEATVEAVAAQRLGGAQPGQRRPDHGHGLQRHASVSSAFIATGVVTDARTRIDPCPGGADKGRCYGAYLAEAMGARSCGTGASDAPEGRCRDMRVSTQ